MTPEQIDALERLSRLKEKGDITPEEFEQQKAGILKATITARSINPSLLAPKPQNSQRGCLTFVVGAFALVVIIGLVNTVSNCENEKRAAEASGALREKGKAYRSQVLAVLRARGLKKARELADSIAVSMQEVPDDLSGLRDTLSMPNNLVFKRLVVSATPEQIARLRAGKTVAYTKFEEVNRELSSQVLANLRNRKAFEKQAATQRAATERQMAAARVRAVLTGGRNFHWERNIKNSINDPDSYEHDATSVGVDDDGDPVIITRFRARNGFGGMATGYATGRYLGGGGHRQEDFLVLSIR